jgi:hypothetical protein
MMIVQYPVVPSICGELLGVVFGVLLPERHTLLPVLCHFTEYTPVI